MGERKIERETGAGERKREIGRETGVGERERERERGRGRERQGIKRKSDGGERKNYKHKIHGILSCRASIRLPKVNQKSEYRKIS